MEENKNEEKPSIQPSPPKSNKKEKDLSQFSESTKLKIEKVIKIKADLIAGEKAVEDFVSIVKPQYTAPTHICFGVFNIIFDYCISWYYKLPALDFNTIDFNACSKMKED